MKGTAIGVLTLFLFGAGCSGAPFVVPDEVVDSTPEEAATDQVVKPIDPEAPWGYHTDVKVFGQLVHDRFDGYHTGEDIEVPAEFQGQDIPVRAAYTGSIVYKQWVSGYGGVVILQHEISGETYRTLYGHLDISSVDEKINDQLTTGQQFAILGAPHSTETDGERQHLHFGVWKGKATQLAGYTNTEAGLASWINPQDFYKLEVN